jgi:hypothetical protein
MADDEQKEQETGADQEPDERASEEEQTHGSSDPSDDWEFDEDDLPDGEELGLPPRTTFVANPANQAYLGTLTLHYPERDVTVLLDGDAALRVMAAHQRRRHAGYGDRLEPSVTSAHTAWVTLDPQEPLAMSWLPGLPHKPSRMAIDPPAELLGG